MIIEVEIEEVE
jgi:hypothetical protein